MVVTNCAIVANEAGHLVEFQALGALDDSTVIVVLPRCEHEQPPLCAGLKSPPTWFGKRRKAILLQRDEAKTMFKGGSHHFFLSLTDARRHQYSTSLGFV